jgi:GNAT superfamily N-acetyltransferase
MIIRPAGEDDYPALMALCNAFKETDMFSQPGNDSFQVIMDNDNSYILVAEEDDKLFGFITASIRFVVRYSKPMMQVEELFVNAASRKKGVGRQLIQTAEKIASEKDCERIYIESGYRHEVAHKFYEKNGYDNQGYYFLKII